MKHHVPWIALPDDIDFVTNAKYLDDINNLFDITFATGNYPQWIELKGQGLAAVQTESVLKTCKKKFETVPVKLGGEKFHPSKSFDNYG